MNDELNKMRKSGLLELYAYDLLSEDERNRVERYIETYPEIIHDIFEIQNALFLYSKSVGIVPKNNLQAKIISLVKEDDSDLGQESTS